MPAAGRRCPARETHVADETREVDGWLSVFQLPLRKPAALWLPSQYGLLRDCPQRHSQPSVMRLTVLPVPVTTSRLPRTCKGPSAIGSTRSGPSRCARGCDSATAASPLAAKAAAAWLPSQNGFRADAPQRHSVTLNPSSAFANVTGAWNASGPFSRNRTVLTTGAASPGKPSILSYRIAPEGQLRASAATSPRVARSGWIHSPDTFGTNTSGRSSTQLREWMQRSPSK